MNILMLVNWKIEYTEKVPENKQPPDYYVPGHPYWFFKYVKKADKIHVDVVDIRSFSTLEKFEQNTLRFYVWQTLKCIPKLKKYDVILSHGMQSGIVLCLWRRLFGKGRYKHIVFDIGAFNSGREEGRALKLMQFASKSLDGVIYHTEIQKEYYAKCHPWLGNKAEFISFGTDSEYFARQRKSEERDTKKKDIEEKKAGRQRYILCIGHNKRDWNTLFKAYGEIKTEINLRLIGNGEIKTENPQIEVLDRVDVTELKDQIENAYFCVLPLKSFRYSYGQMTLLQQMAMGKAVIVANVPSVSAYLREGAMLYYEPENKEMLREKMQQLIEEPELCEKLGREAEYVVRTKFNEKNMALEIEKMIEKYCGGHNET